MEFGPWFPLTPEGVAQAPDAPAALQVRREHGLLRYPQGRSAMVFYAFAASGARSALLRRFADELATAGAEGHGPLLYRTLDDDGAQDHLEELLDRFVKRFGSAPALHPDAQASSPAGEDVATAGDADA
jgi:hypothetical protein